MPSMTVSSSDQKVPAYYQNRKFAITYNLPKLSRLADTDKHFPSLPQDNALALAALALVRLRTAQTGVANANDGTIAGSVAAWNAELAAAENDADVALAMVRAAIPLFVTAQQVFYAVSTYSTTHGKTSPYAPSQLPATWDTGIAPNVAPVREYDITQDVAINTAINLNFHDLSGIDDPNGDVLLTDFNGTPVPAAGVNVQVGGVQFHVTQAGVVTAPAQNAAVVFEGTYTLTHDADVDPVAAKRNFTINVVAAQ